MYGITREIGGSTNRHRMSARGFQVQQIAFHCPLRDEKTLLRRYRFFPFWYCTFVISLNVTRHRPSQPDLAMDGSRTWRYGNVASSWNSEVWQQRLARQLVLLPARPRLRCPAGVCHLQARRSPAAVRRHFGGPIRKDRVFFYPGFDEHLLTVPSIMQFANGASSVVPQPAD
jgi:hypothetical protein